jgi:hypothetical protein
MREKRNAYRISLGKPGEKDHLLWGTLLKWILEEQDGVVWTEFVWLRSGTGGGLL